MPRTSPNNFMQKVSISLSSHAESVPWGSIQNLLLFPWLLCTACLESGDLLQSLAGAQCPGMGEGLCPCLWKDRQLMVRTLRFSCAGSCQQRWKFQVSFLVPCVYQIKGVKRWREIWPQESWGSFSALLQAAARSQPRHWEMFKPLTLAATRAWCQSSH